MIQKLIKYYFEINQWQKMPVEKVKKLQLERFRALFNYAKEHTAFYHKLYKDTGVYDLDIKSFEDISKIPVTDKQMMRQYEYRDLLTQPVSSRINKNFTSGSSGEPFRLYADKYTDYTAHVRVFHVLRKIAHYTPLKKMVLIERFKEKETFQIEQDISLLKLLQKYLGLFERDIISSYQDPDIIIEQLTKSQPFILWATPSVTEILANRLAEQGLDLKIPYLFLVTENVSPIQFEKFRKNVSIRIVDIYGCMESPSLAYEINQSGKKELYPNSALVEFVNKYDTSQGQEGTIIVTNLLNYTMPFIRYNLKDYGVVLDEPDFPNKIIGTVRGRTDDILTFPDGSKFVHIQAYAMFMDFMECDAYKFSQKGNDTIKLQLQVNKNFSCENVKTKALERWNKKFQYPLEIEFVDQLEINPKTGKRKNIEKL